MKALSRFELYELVRDATTVNGAQRALLDSLAWRVNPQKSYTCFPSYDRLVEDTHYAEQNLRIAARKLEDTGLIQRVKRPHRSNLFYLNVRLLLEMKKVKQAKKAEESAAKSEPDTEIEDLFNTAQLSTNDDKDDTDGLELEHDDQAELPAICESVEDVAKFVMYVWDAHASVTEPKNRKFLIRDLRKCVDIAGGPRRCGELLRYLNGNDPQACTLVANSDRLGRYLVSMVPRWLEKYADALSPIIEGVEESNEYY